MLRVNLSDGSTLRLDLEHPEDRAEWEALVTQSKFQKAIRGAAIQREGVSYVLPLPQKFGEDPTYTAELVWDVGRDRLAAERITCYVDTIRIDLTVYLNGTPPMARIDLKKVGRRRHMSLVLGENRETNSIDDLSEVPSENPKTSAWRKSGKIAKDVGI